MIYTIEKLLDALADLADKVRERLNPQPELVPVPVRNQK